VHKSLIAIILLVLIGAAVCPVYAYNIPELFPAANLSTAPAAGKSKVTAVFESGSRTATEYTEDRDVSGNLEYQRYDLRFDQELDKTTKYYFAYEQYHKDYSALDNFDSTSYEYHGGFAHTFENVRSGALKLDMDIGLREKDYRTADPSDYARSSADLGLDYKYGDSWDLYWRNGFVNYEYLNADGDQLKLYTKLGGKLWLVDKRLELGSSYKYEGISQHDPSLDRSEHIVNTISSYKFNLPYLNKVSALYEFGRNDTRDDDEDRDDVLTFKYTRWYVSSEHPILKNLDTAFKYGENIRGYDTSPNNYHTWYAENKTNLNIFEDKAIKVVLSTQLEHRDGAYVSVDALKYRKDVAGTRLSFKVKNNWELAPSFTFKKYDYRDNHVKDEQDYDAKIEFVKEFNQNLDIRITVRNCWKDYRLQPDLMIETVNAGIEYKF